MSHRTSTVNLRRPASMETSRAPLNRPPPAFFIRLRCYALNMTTKLRGRAVRLADAKDIERYMSVDPHRMDDIGLTPAQKLSRSLSDE